MPMQQSCGAGCDGQLRYGGSSRPSNILSPGLGCNRSRMHHIRSGGTAAAGDSSRSARCPLTGGCGAFSASMAQLASSAQCSSRPRSLHSVGGGSSGGSHRLWCSSGSLHCSSPFHGPFSGSGALAAAGGFSRGFSSQPYGSFCGFPGGVGAGAVAPGGFYCGSTSSIMTSSGGSRRGSCCSNVLPPQSHSHQIAKQLEQQQLEMEEAAASAGGSHLSQGHYQYHDCSKHGGSESSYSHLLPEKLHDLVEVIKHPRSHGTQGTRIAVSSLHIGECPGVPENASSFAMKRTGTLKWQPRSALEEDDDICSVRGSISDNCSSRGSNRHNSSGNGHSNVGGTNSKNSSRSSSKSSNSKINNGSTGGTSLGLPRKVHYYLSSHDPKIETTSVAACVASTTGSTAEGGKTGAAGSGGSGAACTTAVTRGQATEATPFPAAFAAESEKLRGSTCRRDAALSGLPAAAAVGLSAGTKVATRVEGSAEETCGGDPGKAGGAQADKKGEQMKRKKTLGFTRRTSNVNVLKASGSAHLQRYQQNRNAKEESWAAAGATCCTADEGDGATTATGGGNSSGGSGGESDHPGPNHLMVTSPSCNSTPSCLSGKESECSGSPRRRLIEPAVEEASHANACTPAAGSGGSEMMRNFSWHKLRQKLKL